MFYRGKRRVRKEPDVFQKTFAGLFEQLRGSGMLLSLLLVGVLVVMAAFWVASGRSSRGTAAAQAKLTSALDQPNQAERLAELAKLAEGESGGRTAPLAMLAEAALLHETAMAHPPSEKGGRDDELRRALALVDKFIAEQSGHRLLPLALERRALILEDQGDWTKAAEQFEAAGKKVSGTEFAYLRGKLLYGQARCQDRLQQREQAVQTLEAALKGEAQDRGEVWRPSASALLAQLRPAPQNLLVKDAAKDPEPPAPETPSAPNKPPAKPGPRK
jgi:tetratricopeptide (TPR) repeat protein